MDITETLLQVFEDDIEIYWIAKEFFELTKEIESELPKLRELTITLLEKEDINLYKYISVQLNNLMMMILIYFKFCCLAIWRKTIF